MSDVARQGYFYDTGDVSLLVGGSLVVAIKNPVNSGRKVIIEGFSFMNQVTALMMAYIIHQPDTTPTNAVLPIPYIMDTDLNITRDNKAVVTQGSVISGGTQLAGMALSGTVANQFQAPPVTLLPGVTLGLKVTATVAGKMGITLNTREESA